MSKENEHKENENIKEKITKQQISPSIPLWKWLLIIVVFLALSFGIYFAYKGHIIQVLSILAAIFFAIGILLAFVFIISKEAFLWVVGKRSEYNKVIKAAQIVSIGTARAAIKFIPIGLSQEEKERLKEDVPHLVQMRFMAGINNFIIRIFVGAFAAAFGLLGTIVLMNQNLKIDTQNSLFEDQNIKINTQTELMDKQTILLDSQDRKFAKQNLLLDTQNKMVNQQTNALKKQNDLFKSQNKLVKEQTLLFEDQNKKLDAQTNLFKDQNQLVKQQSLLQEAQRRSSLIIMMSNIMDKVDKELESANDSAYHHTRKLSDVTIARLAALSHAMKPYQHLEGDTLSKALSPERGQLFLALINSKLDTLNTYPKIHGECNFKKADLSRADLRGAFLRWAFLIGADLSQAHLKGADLRGADLSGADLRGLNSSGADLSGAILDFADLRGADLRGVHLKEADLSRANLNWAIIKTLDWLKKLDEWKVKGREEIKEKYTIDPVPNEFFEETFYYIITKYE